MNLKNLIESILLDGGMSPASSAELSFTLAEHYPDHVQLLLDYCPAAQEPEPVEPPVEEVPPTVE